MKSFLSNIIKGCVCITAGALVILMLWIFFCWVAQLQLNKKARILSNGLIEGRTTAAELFGIKQDEFFCLEPVSLDKPSKHHDYSSIVKAGLKAENIPSYNKWPFEMVLWDPDDVRIMTLSATGKLRRKHLMARSFISSDKWPKHFGCFEANHSIEIIFKDPERKKGMKLEFPDIQVK